MSTVVTQSRTVVPLGAAIVGAATDGFGNMLVDELGNPFVGNRSDALLNAILAVAQAIRIIGRKVDTMSDAQAQVQTDVAQLIADHQTLQTSMGTIQSLLSDLKPGNIDQATIDALNAAAASIHGDAQQAQTIATSTASST